jgi:hypothetical protein
VKVAPGRLVSSAGCSGDRGGLSSDSEDDELEDPPASLLVLGGDGGQPSEPPAAAVMIAVGWSPGRDQEWSLGCQLLYVGPYSCQPSHEFGSSHVLSVRLLRDVSPELFQVFVPGKACHMEEDDGVLHADDLDLLVLRHLISRLRLLNDSLPNILLEGLIGVGGVGELYLKPVSRGISALFIRKNNSFQMQALLPDVGTPSRCTRCFRRTLVRYSPTGRRMLAHRALPT